MSTLINSGAGIVICGITTTSVDTITKEARSTGRDMDSTSLPGVVMNAVAAMFKKNVVGYEKAPYTRRLCESASLSNLTRHITTGAVKEDGAIKEDGSVKEDGS